MKKYFVYTLFVFAGAIAVIMAFQIVTATIGQPRMMIVVGDSMYPTLRQNDLLLLDRIELGEIEKGKIVAVDHRDESHPLGSYGYGYTVHRVFQITERGDDLWVKTKGDNNRRADESVPAEDVVAKVTYSVPVLGFVLSPPVNFMIIFVLAILAVREGRL